MVLSELESTTAARPSLCFFVEVYVYFQAAKGPSTAVTLYHYSRLRSQASRLSDQWQSFRSPLSDDLQIETSCHLYRHKPGRCA